MYSLLLVESPGLEPPLPPLARPPQDRRTLVAYAALGALASTRTTSPCGS